MEPLPSDDLYKERYTVEKKIGQGGFGKVFLVKEKGGEKCFAAKCIKVREVLKNATGTILKKHTFENCGIMITFQYKVDKYEICTTKATVAIKCCKMLY